MVGPSRPEIVLFGSSIVQLSFAKEGWGAILSHLYSRKADIVLRGYCGWNTRRALQVLDTIFPKVLQIAPSFSYPFTLIYCFNLLIKTHPFLLIQNLTLANNFQSLSNKTRLVFLTAPPCNEVQIYGNRDGIHLTHEGSKIVVKEILNTLKEADWEPCLHWKSLPNEFGEDSPYDPLGPDEKTINVASMTLLETMEYD
ncbi:hypothetical protein RYX36_029768 [Vicia faba]